MVSAISVGTPIFLVHSIFTGTLAMADNLIFSQALVFFSAVIFESVGIALALIVTFVGGIYLS